MKKSKTALSMLLAMMLLISSVSIGAVSVSAATVSSVNGVLDIEAEDLPWDEAYLGMTSGDAYSDGIGLNVLKEVKDDPQVSDPAHLDASFVADVSGTYKIWVRATASYSNSAGRSVWLSINNAAYKQIELKNDNGQPPKWLELATVSATAGQTVSLRIRRRQSYNIVLDRFYYTTDTSFTPDDTNLPPKVAVPISLTANKLTTLRESLNGWYGMTAGKVLADCSADDDFTLQIYNADGSAADLNAPAKEGMYVRVAKSESKFVDYPLVYDDHRVSEITYGVSSGTGAWCWDENGYKNAKLNATVTVDSYTDAVSKNYTLIVMQMKGNTVTDAVSQTITMNGVDSRTITINYNIENGKDASYQIYLWDDLNAVQPLKKAYVLSPKFAGKKMAVFGDSITNGYLTYASDLGLINGMMYSSNTAETSVYNVGVAGARMSYNTYDSVNSCSMVSLVDAFTNPASDLSAQQTYLNSAGSWTNTTFTYGNIVALKSAIADVDYATVFYGTNDFTANVVLDNASDPYDTSTFGGATRYSVEKLLAANPDMQILLIAPMYRDRQIKTTDTNTDLKNSDVYPNGNGDYLREFGAKLEEIAENYDNVYFYDMYEDSGINKYNQANYFYDGLHPIGPTHSGTMYMNGSAGHRLLASKFSGAMQMFFK